MNNYADSLKQLTKQYNDAILALKDSYNMESTQAYGWNITSSHLRRQYSKRYEALAREYLGQRQQLFANYVKANPQWARRRTLWKWLLLGCFIAAVFIATMSIPDNEDTPTVDNLEQSADRYWNADNIPIPYLNDATQYVSNPDSVLSQPIVNRMNTTLQRLEKELGVQSVVIVVNHIEGDDPFRMAQDVGNKYGVGHDDRGLMVVVGYEDHSINISPGRALEADLTDAECYRLEQRYVIPAMRAEMPDSGMLYLTEAVYATLQKKDLPVMSELKSKQDEYDDDMVVIIGAMLLFTVIWATFFLLKNDKYQWVPIMGAGLLANPFAESSDTFFVSGGGGGFGGGFGGGGGGFSGGSFGGGSFGGGGATSRW